MIPHKTLGSGISGTVRYVLGEGKRDPVTGKVPELAPGAQSRVAWYGGTGFGFPIDSAARLDVARRLMEWAAQTQTSKTRQCRDDCLHLSLAWAPEERPTRGEMEAAAHSVLKHLGMENARAIFAAHTDTDHQHLHLVISRIDPDTGKAFPDSFDTLALSAWALQWEQEHGGVRCEARLDREKQRAERDPEKVLAAFTGRRETFTAFDLNRELTAALPSRETRRAYIGAVLARPEMVRLADPESGQVLRYTTRQTLAAEALASGSAERLMADRSHQVSEAALRGVVERLRADGKTLRDDQMQAWRHATGAAGLAVIAGKAGTGKSFALTAIAAAYQAEGHAVQALAPTNKVAAALKRDGLDAATLHSLLGRLDRGQAVWNGKTVVMVDEAGMVSTRLMARLLSHAEHAGAKVILVGDDKQLASMERGGLFGYLAARHGAGTLDEITRQHGADQRELARRASRYDFQAALTALEAQGGLVTVETPEARIARAVELWGQRSAGAPDSSLFVITVSNADAQAVNLAIRDIRRGRGDLGPDILLPTADGPQAFATGDRILFSGSVGTREGRTAGLVNGNAGVIAAIADDRITVALDGARPGATVAFTVGPDRDGGAFDAIRHGYAGTIYKAQGATYDHTIVVDSPMMRASSGYVALTRHRDSVTVVTAPQAQPGPAGWQSRTGGIEALTATQRASAETSYAAWRAGNPAAGQRHDLAAYVAYVQGREATRHAHSQAPGQPVDDMAKRWRRIEDRRAASRFMALDYEPPMTGKLDPAAVRAAVGIEAFERDEARLEPTIGNAELARSRSLVDTDMPRLPFAPRRSRAADMALEPPTDDELRQQPEREAQYLKQLREHHDWAKSVLEQQRQARELEDRAKWFQRGNEQDAEEARKKKSAGQNFGGLQGLDRNGDISSAQARYSIAIGEHYNARDPYASLARAAGAESASFHRNQERLREAAAKESDPDKRQAIELRRTIEGCDYMAITNDRLARISEAVTGRTGNEHAMADRAAASEYRQMATSLREERAQLLERVEAKEATATLTQAQSATPAAPDASALQARSESRPAYRQEMPAAAPAPAVQPEPPAVLPSAAKDAAAQEALARQVNAAAFADLRARRAAQPSLKAEQAAAPAPEAAPPAQVAGHGQATPKVVGPDLPGPTRPDTRKAPLQPAAARPAPPAQPQPPVQDVRAAPTPNEAAPAAPPAAKPTAAPQPTSFWSAQHNPYVIPGVTPTTRRAAETEKPLGPTINAPQSLSREARPFRETLPPRQSDQPALPAQQAAQATSEQVRSPQPDNREAPPPAPVPRPRSQGIGAGPAPIMVMDGPDKAPVPLSTFMQHEQPRVGEPYRAPPMGVLLSDSSAWKQHQMAQERERETVQKAEQALGRLGNDLEKGRSVQAEDLRSLTREQWDGVRSKGEAGLTQSVREAKDRSAQDLGHGRGDGPRRKDP